MALVLVIDDEELVRMTLTQMLERDGHSVIEASDGERGIEAFRQTPPDLVICDILMPVKEGIETIMELRRIKADAKIIAMSGGGRQLKTSYLEVAKEPGANTILKKPFHTEELRDAVNACLRADSGAS